jgi:uncharacterized protein
VIVTDLQTQPIMLTQIPKLASSVIIRPIDDNFSYAVNCIKPRSIRVLTKAQHALLDIISHEKSIEQIAAQFSVAPEIVLDIFSKLASSGIISFGNDLADLPRPLTPKALSFWIHTTNRCNLACTYCYISTLHQTGGMSDSVKAKLIEKLVEVSKKRFISKIKLRLAGGEPLIDFKSWFWFVMEARGRLLEVGCELSVSIVTNLTLLTDEILQFARAENIAFGVSIDGLGIEHDKTRPYLSGRSSFVILEKNLQKLIETRVPVSTTTVITNSNLAGMEGLTEYLIDLNIPFRYSIVRGQDVDAIGLEENLSKCFKVMKEAIDCGWKMSSRFQFCDLKPAELGFQTCDSGFSGGAINVDGTLKYCHTEFGQLEKQQMSIFRDDLDFVEMIEQGPHPEQNRSADCRICKYRAICTSGCPVYRKNGKDPQCSIYHKFIPQIYDLYALERLHLLRKHEII